MNSNGVTRIKDFYISDYLLLFHANLNVTRTIYVPQIARSCECT